MRSFRRPVELFGGPDESLRHRGPSDNSDPIGIVIPKLPPEANDEGSSSLRFLFLDVVNRRSGILSPSFAYTARDSRGEERSTCVLQSFS